MSLINIKNLSFGYDGTDILLFKDVSIGIDTSWRLALAGRNGRGKTTFFKLLKGELEHEGSITGVPQTVSFPSHEFPDVPDWNLEIAARVGFSSGQYFSQAFQKHSGLTPKEYRRNNGHAE